MAHVYTLLEYLNYQVERNDRVPLSEHTASPYEGRSARFTAAKYAKRILKRSRTSPCCLIAALIYIQRIQRRRPNLRLSSRTLQRLFLVAAMISAKYLEDLAYFNSYWSIIGRVGLQELNALELDFLLAIDFDLVIRPEDYTRCTDELQAFRAGSSGRRGCSRVLQIAAGAWALARDASLCAARAWGWLTSVTCAARGLGCRMVWTPCTDSALDRLLPGQERASPSPQASPTHGGGPPSPGAAPTRDGCGSAGGAAPTCSDSVGLSELLPPGPVPALLLPAGFS